MNQRGSVSRVATVANFATRYLLLAARGQKCNIDERQRAQASRTLSLVLPPEASRGDQRSRAEAPARSRRCRPRARSPPQSSMSRRSSLSPISSPVPRGRRCRRSASSTSGPAPPRLAPPACRLPPRCTFFPFSLFVLLSSLRSLFSLPFPSRPPRARRRAGRAHARHAAAARTASLSVSGGPGRPGRRASATELSEAETDAGGNGGGTAARLALLAPGPAGALSPIKRANLPSATGAFDVPPTVELTPRRGPAR